MNYIDSAIITTAEWLNWISRGYARISHDRIKPFDYTEVAFENLMSACVDNNLDEGAFVFVKFNKELGVSFYKYRTHFSNYIDLTAVQAFYALTERGQRLLTYEAEVSHCYILADSRLESLWNNWCDQQVRLLSKDKGNKFLNILRYQPFQEEYSNIQELQRILEDSKNSFSDEQLKLLNGNNKLNIFAWGYTTFITKSKLRLEVFEYIKTFREFESDNLNWKSDYLATNQHSLARDRNAVKKVIAYERQLKLEQKSLPLLALLVYIHYNNLVDQSIEINLKHLKEDLSLLDFYYDSNNYSRQIAYSIGQRLDEVLVNVLYVANNFEKYQNNQTLIQCNFKSIRSDQLEFNPFIFDQFKEDIIEVDNILHNFNLPRISDGDEKLDTSNENSLGLNEVKGDAGTTTELPTEFLDDNIDTHVLLNPPVENEEKNDNHNEPLDQSSPIQAIIEAPSNETNESSETILTEPSDDNIVSSKSTDFNNIVVSESHDSPTPVNNLNPQENLNNESSSYSDALLEIIDKFLSFETTGQSQDAQVKESSNNEDRSDHELVIEDFRSALKQELENIISAFPKISADSLYEKIKPIYLRYSNDEKVKKEKAFIDMYYIITGQKVASGAFTKLKDFLADPNGKLDI